VDTITRNTAVTPDARTELDDLLTTKEAAKLAGVKEGTIRYWASVGKLEAVGHIGRSPRYLHRDVARVERETRMTGKAPLRNDPYIAGRQILDHRARNQAA
jgi:excisionase family DNA binding protein